ncbi:MAG TPA: hypothetical protein VLA24_16910 [Pseudomonadales bacterium]|jgi:hypothetical protein|nr:hypothetical protein [Pseudomonadales bacterium]
MTVSISTIRNKLAVNLATVPGLRTSDYVPDDPKPPVAVVMPPTIKFDIAMGRGLDEYEFIVTVIVGKQSERAAQRLLDSLCAPKGSGSVKTAIEIDRTLAGNVQDLRVTEMRRITSLLIDQITYLAAEFTVQVYA